MKVTAAILGMTCCVLFGCSRPRDPLKDFKAVVNLLETGLNGCYPLEKSYTLKVSDPGAVRFNVEKTSSLVSPYTGTIDYFRYVGNITDTPAGPVDDPSPTPFQFRINFAYQDERWVLQDVSVVDPDKPSEHLSFWVSRETKCWRGALDKFYKPKSG